MPAPDCAWPSNMPPQQSSKEPQMGFLAHLGFAFGLCRLDSGMSIHTMHGARFANSHLQPGRHHAAARPEERFSIMRSAPSPLLEIPSPAPTCIDGEACFGGICRAFGHHRPLWPQEPTRRAMPMGKCPVWYDRIKQIPGGLGRLAPACPLAGAPHRLPCGHRRAPLLK